MLFILAMIIPKNVILPEKRDHITGNAFHVFYSNTTTAHLFDSDLSSPIIWGDKNVVRINALYKLDELTGNPPGAKVWVFTYIMTADGYRKKQTVHAAIQDVRKYLLKY